MTEVTDLELVLDSIAALDILPPRSRRVHLDGGDTTLHDWGTLIQEFELLAMVQGGHFRALETRVLGDGSPLDPVTEAGIRKAFDEREARNKWAALPWGRERLSKLMMRHLDDAVYAAPHHGFQGPRAGENYLAFARRHATAVEWLVHCPERCTACQVACRRDLERLRRALVAETEQKRRNDPAVQWRKVVDERKPKLHKVEVWDGTRRAAMKGRKAELFLSVADRSPRALHWKEYIRARLAQSGVRRNGKPTRRRTGEEETPTLLTLNEASVARMGRSVRAALGTLGSFWNQDRLGASWAPPEGSGPATD